MFKYSNLKRNKTTSTELMNELHINSHITQKKLIQISLTYDNLFLGVHFFLCALPAVALSHIYVRTEKQIREDCFVAFLPVSLLATYSAQSTLKPTPKRNV